jgi:hypothetical protein
MAMKGASRRFHIGQCPRYAADWMTSAALAVESAVRPRVVFGQPNLRTYGGIG